MLYSRRICEIHKKSTLKKIAQITSKSVNTVSRALNNKDGVAEHTRESILRAAQALNYRPNLIARGMRQKRTDLIGILVQEISNPFFTRMLQGAEEEANRAGMTVLIGDSKGIAEKEQEHINTFLSYHCCGLALCLISPTSEQVNELKRDHVNYLMLDAPLKKDLDCDRICIDNERDSFTAVDYLIRCGHRRIAIVSPKPHTTTMQERFSGYKRALQSNSLDDSPELIRICEGKDEAYQASLDLTGQRNAPTAIYVAKQSLGLSVISACMNAGVRIPEDISIVIFGEPDWATVFRPRITCMQRQVTEIGRLGIRRLLEKMKHQTNDFRKIVLDSHLMIRDSVKEI